MSKRKLMCNLFREADGYFNDENVDTQKFNKHSIIKGYCSNGGCKTNEDRINALGAYIFKKLKDSITRIPQHNNYDEYLLMWISDKLFKMHLESKGKKDIKGYIDATTLNQAYDKYLKNHKGMLDYWTHLNIKKGLKEANLKYMSEFYKLLNNICKTITDYNDNGAQSKKLSKYSSNCNRQYRTLYMNIYECKSYLYLLNKLKGIYDDFRSYSIRNNGSKNILETKLIKITLENGKEMDTVRGFKSYDFSGSQCKLHKKKKKIDSSKKADPPPLQASSKEEPPPQPLKQQTSQTQSQSVSPIVPSTSPATPSVQSPDPLPVPSQQSTDTKQTDSQQTGPLPAVPPSQDGGSLQTPKTREIHQNGPGGSSDGKGDSNSDPGVKSSGSSDGQDGRKVGSNGVAGNQNTHPESGSPSSGTGNGNSNKGGAGLGTGNPGSVSGGEPGSEQIDQGSSDGGTKDTKSVQSGVPDGQISNGSQGGVNTSQQGTSGGSGHGT
ncbi:CIR protein PIR protein, partial [Plasmodium vinckei brucechwatti]